MPEKPTETKTQQIMAERKENTARVTAELEAQGVTVSDPVARELCEQGL